LNLREIPLKSAYDTDVDNVLNDFYIPALSNSIHYYRLSGFFSSSTLASAAKGITGLIKNGGDIRLITGATFQEKDIEAIKAALESPEEIIEQSMLKELENLEEGFVKDHVKALAWLIAKRKLKIKIAIVLDTEGYPLTVNHLIKNGIFHQKVGILEDSLGNRLSFSGSDNETANGWKNNVEEFKVFRDWMQAEKDYFEADLAKFEKFWFSNAKRTKIIDIPKAIEEKLITIAPQSIEEVNLDNWGNQNQNSEKVGLRSYQKAAMNSWLDNNKTGILEMATGTGKTFVALSCLKEVAKKEEHLVTVISAPYVHLNEQWQKEAEKFGIKGSIVTADSSESKWRDKLVDALLDVENGVSEQLCVFTTHTTFSSEDFIAIIEDSKKRRPEEKILLIVDEVHGIGALQRRNGLIDAYDYKLGLSATPKRWFDDDGTLNIFDYFGKVVYSFPLGSAIEAGYLTPYIYKPYFTFLTDDELDNYEAETKKVSRAYYCSQNDAERQEMYTLLCIKRQKIIRNATNKLEIFKKILQENQVLKHCLIYCSPQQIDAVQYILNDLNIIQHKFTEAEGTRPEERFKGKSERDVLLEQFSNGSFHALVSMKCLDEGVDVPPARIAIMLDNSGNPREYIQRRGRVLRKHPGKALAVIYDIIVEPTIRSSMPLELKELERKIIAKELSRYRDFAETASNRQECFEIMQSIELMYGVNGNVNGK
jgi:superfamily II DNA or RNA helicase